MVYLTNFLCKKATKPIRNYLRAGFRDTLRIFVQAGAGGNGYPKFGGVGGKGGDVKVVAKENYNLEDLYRKNTSRRVIGNNGRHSTHNFILGVPGETVTFDVPVGVSIFTEFGKKLGELNSEGEELVIAKGGPGGHSKNGFLGVKGQTYSVKLDLKLIADIGLVGFPNAGKSTLLNGVSNARPKIASYPFTTIRPNIGILSFKDLRTISMADLPGLIEGAYANRGMGHEFLKHVERTKLLLLIVDINGFQLSPQYPHRSCLDTILLLNKELELYDESLLAKPAMLLINKMDSEGAEEKYEEVQSQLKNLKGIVAQQPDNLKPTNLIKFNDVMAISAKTNKEDLTKVKWRLRELLDIMAELEKNDQEENADLFKQITQQLKEKNPSFI